MLEDAYRDCVSHMMHSRSVKVAPPHRKSTIYYSLEFWAFFGLFLGTDKNFWAPLLFTENQISCGGASLHKASTSTKQKFEKIKNKLHQNFGLLLGFRNHLKPIINNHPYVQKNNPLFKK